MVNVIRRDDPSLDVDLTAIATAVIDRELVSLTAELRARLVAALGVEGLLIGSGVSDYKICSLFLRIGSNQ